MMITIEVYQEILATCNCKERQYWNTLPAAVNLRLVVAVPYDIFVHMFRCMCHYYVQIRDMVGERRCCIFKICLLPFAILLPLFREKKLLSQLCLV